MLFLHLVIFNESGNGFHSLKYEGILRKRVQGL